MVNNAKHKTYAEQLSQFIRDFTEVQLYVTLLPSDLARDREAIDKMRFSGAPERHNVYAVLLHILSFLSQANRPTMTELRQALSLSRSTAGRMVDFLVTGGFCKRYSDKTDKRIIRVAITRKGHRALQSNDRYIAKRTDRILHGLTIEDQATLFAIFNKIASNIRKIRGF